MVDFLFDLCVEIGSHSGAELKGNGTIRQWVRSSAPQSGSSSGICPTREELHLGHGSCDSYI